MAARFLLAGLCAALSAAPAAAQGGDWSGFHVGVNGSGYEQHAGMSGTGNVDQLSGLFVPNRGIVIVPGTIVSFGGGGQFNPPMSQSSRHKETASFGAQAGFDWQFGGVVAGIEGDIQGTRRSTTNIYNFQLPFTALTPLTNVTLQRTARINTEWSLRARIGATLGPSTLLYATGGLAGARVRLTNTDTFFDPGGPAAPNSINGQTTSVGQANFGASGPTVSSATFSKTKLGWTAGGGLEQRIGSHLSIALEYRHTDLRTVSYAVGEPIVSAGATITDTQGNHPSVQPSVSSSTTNVKLRSDAIGLRLNFRF